MSDPPQEPWQPPLDEVTLRVMEALPRWDAVKGKSVADLASEVDMTPAATRRILRGLGGSYAVWTKDGKDGTWKLTREGTRRRDEERK